MANPTTPSRTGTGSFTEKGREGISSMSEQAKDVASSTAQRAGEAAWSATQKAKEMASSMGHTASDVASNVGQKAEDATTAVGGSMRSLAGSLRENLPHEGMIGSASSAVAETLDRGGRYLQEEGLQGVGEDLTNLIRRNPIPAVLIGIGVGFLIARSMRS
jgi:ElaB/YqjD/DUF883 family membrane-anchored ribosome-binding protein